MSRAVCGYFTSRFRKARSRTGTPRKDNVNYNTIDIIFLHNHVMKQAGLYETFHLNFWSSGPYKHPVGGEPPRHNYAAYEPDRVAGSNCNPDCGRHGCHQFPVAIQRGRHSRSDELDSASPERPDQQ